MASLLPKNGTLINFANQAPPPQKDFCQILVNNEGKEPGKVIVRWWKMSLRRNSTPRPGEILDTYEDFTHDERCHSEIHRCFGKNMLDYVKALVDGHIDYLPRMPHPLLMQIIRTLHLEDITSLSHTNKMFYQLCNSDELWEMVYHDNSETPVTDDLCSLAEGLSWKRLFFTNKLQLQVKLRRVQLEKAEEVAFTADDRRMKCMLAL